MQGTQHEGTTARTVEPFGSPYSIDFSAGPGVPVWVLRRGTVRIAATAAYPAPGVVVEPEAAKAWANRVLAMTDEPQAWTDAQVDWAGFLADYTRTTPAAPAPSASWDDIDGLPAAWVAFGAPVTAGSAR